MRSLYGSSSLTSTRSEYSLVLGQLIVNLRELIPDERQAEADAALAAARDQLGQVDASLSRCQGELEQPLPLPPYPLPGQVYDWTVLLYALAVGCMLLMLLTVG
ncbi:MAG: hypothetical protein HC837_04650 [Chloroflexaceae bacterium]|nr:hypothetical protein [Chloroflexaceae bacterium]